MKLAILFWFYKEPEVCENRLQLIKEYNPDIKIYGLFGGELSNAKLYQEKLGGYLDDFYAFDSDKNSDWKWVNGDLMILDWYKKRGRDLDWDSIAIIQWDMLVFDSLSNQFSKIKKNQIYLSGLRKLEEKLEKRWYWTKLGGKERQNYLNFIGYIKENYKYSKKILPCCLFIFQIFPKTFFEKYLTVENKEVGMLEYKIPTYAQIFNIPSFEKDIGIMWRGEGMGPLNARNKEIPKEYIEEQLNKKGGWRLFHPYFKIWK